MTGRENELNWRKKWIKFEANALTDSNYWADGGRNIGRSPTTASQFWLGMPLYLEKLTGWERVSVRFVATVCQG